MSSAQKIIQAAAGNAAGEGLYVEEVFSTYLYEGNGSTQTITNDIDLDGEGGLVWIKSRNNPLGASGHRLFDTERGVGKNLQSDDTSAEATDADELTAFNSNGFSVGADSNVNYNGMDVASWTFRKAPKFFDVVTYTGNGTAGHTISHNLGSVPGMIVVKRLDSTSGWFTFHRSLGETKGVSLNTTDASATEFWWNQVAPTDSSFQLNGTTNISGASYVAYLFAHNDGDGEFGKNADQDIIKCGSFSTNASGQATIDLGFEPQWVLMKQSDGSADWFLFDTMRGFTVDGVNDEYLRPNTSNAGGALPLVNPTSTGFETNYVSWPSQDWIYIAIRRGPMKTPESGTEVFDAHEKSGYTFPTTVDTGFVTDAIFHSGTTSAVKGLNARLTTLSLPTYASFSESSFGSVTFDYSSSQDGFTKSSSWGGSGNQLYYSFRRAPGFFDVVAYEGTGSLVSVNHNLGVTPELVIVKNRDAAEGWAVVGSALGGTNSRDNYMRLDLSDALSVSANYRDADDTDTTFGVRTNNGFFDSSGTSYIAYLFATLDGISKVGSYTGNGTSQTIDCGFSTGARFVLIKRTDSTGDWHVYDSERGIVAGNDPRLELNTNDAEDTGSDDIDPVSSGFSVTSNADVNTNTASYVFLAIS